MLESLSAYAKHVSPLRSQTLGSDQEEAEIPPMLDGNKHKYLQEFIMENASHTKNISTLKSASSNSYSPGKVRRVADIAGAQSLRMTPEKRKISPRQKYNSFTQKLSTQRVSTQ